MASLTWFVLLLAGLTYTHAIGNRETIQNLPSICQVDFSIFLIWSHQCACSLITTGHCLSAASCFRSSPNDRRIRCGSDTSGWGGTTRQLNNIVNHPEADLSVVRLITPFWPGPTIQQIPIVPQGFHMPPNIRVSIAGWGSTAQGGIFTNLYLYRAEVESRNTSICMTQHPGRVTTANLCVGLIGSPGRDFDDDDAGTPIIYLDFLAGVASFGSSFGNNMLPIVSTAVGNYTNWIVSAVV